MILKGKYNEAVVYTDNVDNETISQVINLCNQEFLKDSKIRIMPDCHAGKGCTIGTTMTISDKVVVNLVGVDIGCGVAGIKLNGQLDLELLDETIRTYVPHGFKIHSKSREKLLKDVFGVDLHKIKCDVKKDRAFLSIGTLGGGNHFIEVDRSAEGVDYLIVHTGSRNLGKNIADYYQDKAIAYCKSKYANDSKSLEAKLISDLKEQGRESEISNALKELKANQPKKPQYELCYLEGSLLDDYLNDMCIAQRYAMANRVIIIADILYNYYGYKDNYTFNDYCKNIWKTTIECIHNYIDIDNKILRKGAISAKEGEVVLVPINMRDGVIVARGKGNKEWNYSAPHGAGRLLSRGKAKESISIEEFEESMEGIYTTCVGLSTLDEAPQAYKPMSDILDNINDTLDIVEIIKPVYNFKSN